MRPWSLRRIWVPMMVVGVSCSPRSDPVRVTCAELTWTRGGVAQIGPLVPARLLFDTAKAGPESPEEAGPWWRVRPVPGSDDTVTVGNGFAVSWPTTYTRRGWRPVGRDSLILFLGDPTGLRWRSGVAVSGDSLHGAGWYGPNRGDSALVEVAGRRQRC